MRALSDTAIERLREAVEWPDLTETRYEALEVLGQGGMGTVYRARDHQLQREVALKVLRGTEDGSQAADRLLREARILADLEHPGLVPVHDAGLLPDGRPFYVMRLVRGVCLDRHVEAQALERGPRLRLFLRVCEAVAFAHARGVLHRDLKPQNVMVGPFGEVLVMDWGVAKLRAEAGGLGAVPASRAAEGHTREGTVLGTPGYMAPELTGGQASSADERTDVYALGALLHFLLAGRPPSAPGAPTLRSEGGRVPAALAAVVARATAAERGERYPSVSALAEDLERFLEALPVSAYPEGVVRRLLRVAGKYRVAIALVLAYLVMRVAFIFFYSRP